MSRFIPPEIHFGKVYRCNKTNCKPNYVLCRKANRQDAALVKDKEYVIPIKTLYDRHYGIAVLLLKGNSLVIAFNSEFINHFDLVS